MISPLFQSVNPFAILLASLIGFAISGLWHSWLVPRAWFRAHELHHIQPGGRHHTLASRKPVLTLSLLAGAYLLTAIGLAAVQPHWPLDGWRGGLSLAAVLVMLISIPQQMLAVVSNQLNWQAWLLDVLNRSLALTAMCLVVFLLR